MNQLTIKAKAYREQRHYDRGLPRSLYQRTSINPDFSMSTSLSSVDYFDAIGRLPDPTYGETSSERLASIIAMANSLTEEDRLLVTYERGPRQRLPYNPNRHRQTNTSSAIQVSIQCLQAIHDIEVSRRSDDTRVHRRPARQSPPRPRNDRWRQPNSQQGQHHNRHHTHTVELTTDAPSVITVFYEQEDPECHHPIHKHLILGLNHLNG